MPEKKPAKKLVTEKKVDTEESIELGTSRDRSKYVYIEKSVTKNMGDFNSARVTIGCSMPVNPTEEDIKAAKRGIKAAVELVDLTIDRETDELFKKFEE